jgi:hypothetical protein
MSQAKMMIIRMNSAGSTDVSQASLNFADFVSNSQSKLTAG